MGKLSYNDKLRMQTLWESPSPTAWFTQNGWASAVDSTADFSQECSTFILRQDNWK